MILAAFQYRSGRVIALGRIVLALLFALWVWIDPAQPERYTAAGYALLTLYVAYAVILLRVVWSNWWLDFRLARTAFLIDLAMFGAALYCTLGGQSDLVSAHFAFLTFLIASAAVRWNWRVAAVAAAAVCLLYLAVGTALPGPVPPDLFAKLLRRASYMMVLSLIFTWLTVQRGGQLPMEPDRNRHRRAASALEGALAYALEALDAKGGALVWEMIEEPASVLQLAGSFGSDVRHLLPGTVDPDADPHAMLFDVERRRIVECEPSGHLAAIRAVPKGGLAEYLAVQSGFSIPVRGATGKGRIVLTGISGMSADLLTLGNAVGRNVAQLLDENEMDAVAREAADIRVRRHLARDLHDSVAQSLAGASFRVEALRQFVEAGKDPLPEIDAISESLRSEQAQIRQLIERLRIGAPDPGMRNLGAELEHLINGLAHQWQVAIALDHPGDPVMVPAWLVFEVQQMVREGVANAVRHGRAGRIRIALRNAQAALTVSINDNGEGFPAATGGAMPKSVAERADSLGGAVAVSSQKGDTRLEITLPIGGKR